MLSETVYNSAGKVDYSIDENELLTKYEYDQAGNLVETRTYENYDSYDANALPLTISRTLYDEEGRAVVSAGPYDAADSNLPVGTKTIYDSVGRVIETQRFSDVEIFIEDVNNIHKQVVGKKTTGWDKDELLSYEKTIYDTAGRVVLTITLDDEGYEQPTGYKYDAAGKQIAIADANDYGLDKTEEYTENTETGFFEITDTVLNDILNDDIETYDYVSTTEYEGSRRKSVTDDRGFTTEFEYDALNRVIKTIYPASIVEEGGQDPVLTYSHVGYDYLGRKAWETATTIYSGQVGDEVPESEKKYYEYDEAGRVTAVILPQVYEMASPAHNGTMLTNARPRYEYLYDEFGNLTEIRDNIYEPETGSKVDTYARSTTFTYDWLHNQTSREMPDEAKEYKEYDELGWIYYAKDFKGQITGYEYDLRGRLKCKKYYVNQAAYDINDPTETVQYFYDNLGLMTEVIEGEETTIFEYDIEGNLLSIDSPQGIVNYDYALITNSRIATWTDNTDTQYGYDELGSLSSVELIEVNGSTVSKLTTYEYTAVGSRSEMELPNNAVTTYAYDSINRLLNITHEKTGPQQLSKYDYELKADGMRVLLAEDISTGGGRTVGYTYDSLNRVVSESASATSGGYDGEYTYDVIGNRMKRIISANGQCMQTDYVYNNRDQLTKETHIDPGVCFYLDGKPVYAYTSNGRLSHYRLYGSSEKINPLKAYLLGIPSVWARYVFRLVLLILPLIIMMTIIKDIIHRKKRRESGGLSLAKRLLCVVLCYTVFFSSLGFEQLAQASIDYSELSTANWGTVNRDIHYYYDENGSCIEKIEAVKDEADPDNNFIEKTVYEYNLQNRLSLVKTTTDGVNWDITTYKYNDDGIRVEKNDNGTITTYLVDSQNHTGFAQVLEEWDTTSTPTLTKTYIIGDDVIGEADDTSGITYLLYDGQGSVRHHSDSNGNLIAYSGCDTFAYDAYGNRVDPLKDTINDGLFYAGEMYDSESEQYYLRARYYNPLTGLFNRMDDFSGNYSDPQSLHKYLYCHANPVNGIDSSGLFFSLSSINVTALIQATLVSLNVMGVVYHARNAVVSVVNLINAWSVGDFWAGLAYIAIAAMHGLGLVMNVAGICTGLKPPPSAGIPALALSGGGAASIDKIWTVVTSNPQLARWVVRTVGPIAFSAFIMFASKSSGASAEWHHKVSPETKKYDFKNHKLVKKAGWTEKTLKKDPRNGMILYNHKGRHLDKYHIEVQDMLDEAYRRVGTGGRLKAEQELLKVLDRIEKRIENKTLNPCSRDVWIGDS